VRVSKVDKTLTEYVLEEHKPTIFVVNKWDLVKGTMPTERVATYFRSMFPMLDYVPIAFITAKSGKNVHALLNLAQNLHKQASRRVSTPEINQVLRRALADQAPPMRQNRRPKIYYGTQVDANPPTIVLFTNGPHLFDNTYQRYLVKQFRDHLPFRDVPVRLHLRSRAAGGPPAVDEDTGLDVAALPPDEKAAAPKGSDRGKLKFKTQLSDDDVERERKSIDSEIWRDL
jgi:GTP-binding protein